MRHEIAHDSSKRLQPSDYPTVSTVAQHLGVSDETVRRWIRDGRLAAYRVGPRRLRVDPDSLDQVVQAR